jgi:hypothetical protein
MDLCPRMPFIGNVHSMHRYPVSLARWGAQIPRISTSAQVPRNGLKDHVGRQMLIAFSITRGILRLLPRSEVGSARIIPEAWLIQISHVYVPVSVTPLLKIRYRGRRLLAQIDNPETL